MSCTRRTVTEKISPRTLNGDPALVRSSSPEDDSRRLPIVLTLEVILLTALDDLVVASGPTSQHVSLQMHIARQTIACRELDFLNVRNLLISPSRECVSL